uniref:Uncharacterized protein n=1 Tax=Salix viminalis TaxID=40686 RepID=A0A6N2MDQ1_SALVM
MVGVFISVWMKMEFLTEYCISNVKVSSVACGIMGYLGNKGAVSVFASLLLTWLLARREVMKAGGITKSLRFADELHSPPSSEDDDNPLPITILGHEHLSAYAFRGNGKFWLCNEIRANRWQRRGQIYLAITDFQIISKGYRIIAYKHANTIAETEEMQF